MPYAWTVEPGSRVKLKDYDPRHDEGLSKEEGKAKLEKIGDEIQELQELLYAARQHSLLCIFQGRDTAGKDGAINHILSYTNVQGCETACFKVPTAEEAGHDYLWRIHRHTPALGGIALFNRSQYEEVLVVRVHDLVPEKTWKKRFDAINRFESLLTDCNTILLKFYLHISKEEQEERLMEREKDPEKAWKLSVSDWKERGLWDKYTEAYEDALSKCSTEHAPWRIIAADRKWFRDLAIAEAIRDALLPHSRGWLEHLKQIGKDAKDELESYRTSGA